MTFFAVAAEPVKAILLTALRARWSPVWPRPVTSWSTGCSGTTSAKDADQPAAGCRGELARLEDHGVAGRQRVGNRAHRGEDRVVPRADHADTPSGWYSRVAAWLIATSPLRTRRGTQDLAGVPGRPVDMHDRQQDLQLGVGQRLAGLGVHELGQPPDVAGQVRLPGQQPLLAPFPAQLRPPRRGCPGPLDGRRPRPARRTPGRCAMTSEVAGLSVSNVSVDLTGPEGAVARRAWLSCRVHRRSARFAPILRRGAAILRRDSAADA
jgi:hypothetical protein